MRNTVRANGDTFEASCDPIDVTSNHRPDEHWRFTDANGHVHQWHTENRDGSHVPATIYRPELRYITPTLFWVKDGVRYHDDGEPYDIGHLECRECSQHIRPGYTADTNRVYMAGLRRYKINGVPVSPDEFQRRYEELTGGKA